MLYIMTSEGWKPWLPTCVPCSNSNDLQGVYRDVPINEVERDLDIRIDRFLFANGIGSMVEKQQYFRGNHFIVPLHGAFSEKL